MVEKQKKLSIGIDRFSKIRRENFYYVDKTGLIEELLDDWGEVNLFTRPLRFGKSLNMDMLKSFFEIGADFSIFEGLAIWKQAELRDQYMGQYPVISLSFKDVTGMDYTSACHTLSMVISDEAGRLCRSYDLLNSDKLLESDKIRLNDLLTGCLRITKENIFTGLNHFVVNSISDVEFAGYFGFTDSEVGKMLQYYKMDSLYDTIKE